jgi:hypothetical protein
VFTSSMAGRSSHNLQFPHYCLTNLPRCAWPGRLDTQMAETVVTSFMNITGAHLPRVRVDVHSRQSLPLCVIRSGQLLRERRMLTH